MQWLSMGELLLVASALFVFTGAPALAQDSTSGARPPPPSSSSRQQAPPPSPPTARPPSRNLHTFRAPEESTLWLQSGEEWTKSEDVQYELDRRKHPSFTGANDPFGDHGWQGSCAEDNTCLKECETHGDAKCSVIARGCRSCLLTDYDANAGIFHWNKRTYASKLNDYWAQPCFTCGQWEGIMADPERVTMDAPAVYGVATVALSSKQWSPLAADPDSDEGRRFVSAFRTGIAAWVQAVANDPVREFTIDFPFVVPADTVMVDYVHSRDRSQVRCSGARAECVNGEVQRDASVQFATVQWWILVGSGARESKMELNMPTVIEVGCDDTTFTQYDVWGARNTPPIMVDFDTEARGNLGFKLLNCMVDPSAGSTGKSVQTGVLRLGSVIGDYYNEPSADRNWLLDGFILLLIVVLCWCGKKKHQSHMAKWKDIQDGRQIYASDPQARIFIQNDLEKFRTVIQGEKRQAAKYDDEDDDTRETNERLFACFDALSELLQQLIDEGSGKTPRDGIRAACYARIDPQLVNGVISLLDRYTLEKPRARAQRRLEQSIRRSESGQGLQESLMSLGTVPRHDASGHDDESGVPSTGDSGEESTEEESSEEEESNEEEEHGRQDAELGRAGVSTIGNPLSTNEV